jgi:hypothetical protein
VKSLAEFRKILNAIYYSEVQVNWFSENYYMVREAMKLHAMAKP